MTEEIKSFLDGMFAYEEVQPMTPMECAANLQYWREAGVEVPEKLTSGVLFSYLTERIEAAKKAKTPLKVYKITVTETLTANFFVEAHSSDEADEIFETWVDDLEVQDRLVENSEGYNWGRAMLAEDVSVGSYAVDIKWEEGSKLL